MKQIIYLAVLLMATSCSGQIDLVGLQYGEKIPFIENLEQDYSVYVPLEGIYKVKDIGKFKYSNIPLTFESMKFKSALAHILGLHLLISMVCICSYLRSALAHIDASHMLNFPVSLI